ncbi:U3 small nucleolar RNA-associated protein [Coemansia interrupta]|uniref:U3 small nucleolar RNA-associated protein n=1 Tax=Coemansia interrupta TaxID=1126814 RepID=A0A9W8HGK3_9FUNG|nr:U3 small nucleolar RNA-associated protein [Coemansia interrupta]
MQVHRCRFADYVPQAVNAIEFTPATVERPRIAVGRANGDIELWGVRHGQIHYEKTIPGPVNGTLETVAWAHQTQLTADDAELLDSAEERAAYVKRLNARAPRLFSAGLNAVIVEWDIGRLVPRTAVDSYGGAVWCMATNHAQTQLAVGTEDGHIRLFDITDGRLEYVRCFDKINSRILSVAWAADDRTVVTGSADSSVRVWTASTGHVAARMTLPKEGGMPTLVWAVAVLRGGTIVSGDSRGHVVFWDAVMHVAMQDFRAQSADVLTLASDDSGHTVYASGVDPKITQFHLFVGDGASAHAATGDNKRRLKGSKRQREGRGKGSSDGTRWHMTGFRRYHTHDVRALAVSSRLDPNVLISGGVDTQVTACLAGEFPNGNQYRQPCFPPDDSVVSVAARAGLMLQRQGTTLKLWELGAAEQPSADLARAMESGQALQLLTRQRDLLRMEVSASTNLLSCCLSPSGTLVATSDAAGPRLYMLVRAPGDRPVVRARRLRAFPPSNFVPPYSTARGVTRFAFTSDEKNLVMATADGFVVVVDVSRHSSGEFTVVRRHCGHRTAAAEAEADAGCDDVPTHAAEPRSVPEADVQTRSIVRMAISRDDRNVATADSNGLVIVAGINGGRSSVVSFAQGSHRDGSVAALTFDSIGNLVVTTVSNQVFAWDVRRGAPTPWSLRNSRKNIPRGFAVNGDCVAAMVINPAERGVVYAWAANHITRIDFTAPPGPRRAVLNIHKRRHIEAEVLKQVHEEKEQADRRIERQNSKRKRHQAAGSTTTAESDPEAKTGADAEADADRDLDLNTDWTSTYVARLREAGINVNEPHNFRMTQRYQNLMHASFVGDNTMVVVERPWTDVAASLPLAFERHRYVS